MANTTYCPKCDKNVEILEVSRGAQSQSEFKCAECGTTLPKAAPDQRTRPVERARIIIAGYTPAQSDIITMTFQRNGYAQDVKAYENGEDFLTKVTALVGKKEPPKLVIIEVGMPIMNGINAALCMRAIEKGISREKIPILFFTIKPLEEQFVRAIKFLAPAKYVPLPANVDMDTFRNRVEQVVELLKREQW